MLLCFLGLLAAGWAWSDYQAANEDLEKAQRLQQRQIRSVAGALQSRVPASDKNSTIEQSMAQLSLPWNEVLGEIERRTGSSIALLNIEAQGVSRKLRLTGETKSMDEVAAYLKRLRGSTLISSANLVHHEQRQAGSVNLLRFVVEASWSTAP
jgi:Tfp pilus assembly protein PilN